jgi:cell pole-organizing protein PopZ
VAFQHLYDPIEADPMIQLKTMKTTPAVCVLLCALVQTAPLRAQETTPTEPEITLGDVLARLARQEAEIASQRETIARQQEALAIQTAAIQSLQVRVDQLDASTPPTLSPDQPTLTAEENTIRTRLESLEATVEQADASPQQQETTTTYDESEFPGAVPVPGTRAALRIGGFVKMNIVQSFSNLGSQNRFIVGTIPTDGVTEGDGEAALTVQQSRLNLELRENTDVGQLRAFVEGDFAGEGDTFRLRHAFGQFRDLMAGKTWSTFMDVEASPEELDFEGINGRINVRQAQLRWFPQIGEDWNLAVSVEDPAPDVTGGDGVSQIPDINVLNEWSVQGSLLLRTLRARWDLDPSRKEDATGWALSVSGRRPFTKWDDRDNLMFQLNYGKGYGRYVNDLSTVGGQDAVFNDDTGDLAALPVLSSYIAFQHWWHDQLRSTFNASFVNIDNKDFQPGDAYDRTVRMSGNIIYSPTPRIDVGGELLWGLRRDKDGSDGDASQFQASFRYRF